MDTAQIKSKANSFAGQFFPPPEFMRMRAMGIDISDTTIRFIDFNFKKNKIDAVKHFGERRLKPGVISSGYINKPDEIIAILSEVKKETGAKFVNVSLPEEKAYLFKLQLPKLEGAELHDAVGFHIEENAPVSAKEAFFDFNILNENDKSDHLDLMVSVIPSKVSEAYAHVVKAAGFTPLFFEIGSQAVGRAVVSPDSNQSYVVVSFGELKTGIAVMNGGNVFFTSTVPIGSSSLDEAIARKYEVPVEKVPSVKREIMSSGKQDMDIFLEIMESVNPLKDEIKKLSVYWKTHGVNSPIHSDGIDKMILCGADTAMPAVAEYAYAATGIPTEVGNVWRNIFSFDDYIPPISFRESLDYAGAIGLAMI